MTCGLEGMGVTVASLPPLVLNLAGKLPSAMAYVANYKWLGLMWSFALDFSVAMEGVIAAAAAKFSSLAGLASSNVLPLCFVVQMFEAIVEGTMRFGRWLYATAPAAATRLDDDLYRAWGRELLAADAWNNWATVFSEVGWHASGSGRAVQDIASKRAYFFRLDSNDLYRNLFLHALTVKGYTWAKNSSSLLRAWDILDWPEWASEGSSRESYMLYVTDKVHSVSVRGNGLMRPHGINSQCSTHCTAP